jgi:hypothetical protein
VPGGAWAGNPGPRHRIRASSSLRHSTVAAQAGLEGASAATIARTRRSWRAGSTTQSPTEHRGGRWRRPGGHDDRLNPSPPRAPFPARAHSEWSLMQALWRSISRARNEAPDETHRRGTEVLGQEPRARAWAASRADRNRGRHTAAVA